MKRLLIVFIVALGICFIFSKQIYAQEVSTSDIFGYYYIVKAPKHFADISEIHLSGKYGEEQKPPIYGLVRLKRKNAKDFFLSKPKLSNNHLTFTTKAVNSVSYQFKGAFTKHATTIFANVPSGKLTKGIVLKGLLIKLKGKTKIAEANLSFTYFAGD